MSLLLEKKKNLGIISSTLKANFLKQLSTFTGSTDSSIHYELPSASTDLALTQLDRYLLGAPSIDAYQAFLTWSLDSIYCCWPQPPCWNVLFPCLLWYLTPLVSLLKPLSSCPLSNFIFSWSPFFWGGGWVGGGNLFSAHVLSFDITLFFLLGPFLFHDTLPTKLFHPLDSIVAYRVLMLPKPVLSDFQIKLPPYNPWVFPRHPKSNMTTAGLIS